MTRSALVLLFACSSNTTKPPDEPLPTVSAASFASLSAQLLTASDGHVDAGGTVGTASTFDLELLDAAPFGDGSRIHIRTAEHHYLGADAGGIDAVAAKATDRETFTIHRLAGAGPIVAGETVSLETAGGAMVVADANGGAAIGPSLVPWATWTFNGGRAPVDTTFEAANHQLVAAEGGGGGDVSAHSDEVGAWETFHVDLIDNELVDGVHVRIRAANDQFLVAQNHGGGWLHADGNKAGTWETFTLHRLDGPGPIADGDAIAIATDNGHYVVAEGGGGGAVSADRDTLGPWEKFVWRGKGLGPFPPTPSREQVVNVRADFANLRDAKDRPMFTPFIFSLMDDCDGGNADACADVEDWLARLKAQGDTHIAVNLSADYSESLGWAPRYPIHGLDLSKRVPTLRTFLERLIRRGFIPILFLSCDGHASDPNGGYNDPAGWTFGVPWCQAHLPDIIGELRSGRDLAPYILWIGGWDGCFPDWSPEQTSAFHTFLRGLVGPDANIATEFGNGYIHMGNGGSDWYTPGLDQVDVFFIEFPINVLDPNVQCAVQQVAARMLGPAKTFTPSAPCDTTNPPFYLAPPRSPRGPLVVVAWEYAAYLATRKQIDPETARAQADYLYSLGFRLLGNGQPHGH